MQVKVSPNNKLMLLMTMKRKGKAIFTEKRNYKQTKNSKLIRKNINLITDGPAIAV